MAHTARVLSAQVTMAMNKIQRNFPSDRVGKAKEVCQWIFTEEAFWSGTCGLNWTFDTGTPKQNGMNYCPRCGKRLKRKGGVC